MNPIEKKPSARFSIMFQVLNYPVADSRFTPVKIWMMHTGGNYNGSIFGKDVIQAAIPSLANVPLLGLMSEDWWTGQKEFTSHAEEIRISENGKPELVYYGHAYGLIPETNNAQFEMRLCDDGVTREFLTVEGKLWNKFGDAVKTLLQNGGVLPQSMELTQDIQGSFDANGLFVVSSFSFEGACILGFDVQPAMQNSTIEVMFSRFSKQIGEMMKEFATPVADPAPAPAPAPAPEPEVTDDLVISELRNFTASVTGSKDCSDELIRSIQHYTKNLMGGNQQ